MGGDVRRIITAFVIWALVLMPMACPKSVHAKEGKLEKFEKELDKQEPRRYEPHRRDDRYHRHHHRDDDYYYSEPTGAADVATSAMMSMFYSFFLMGLMTGSSATTSSELYHELKASESAALPTIKIEPSYQYLVDNIHGAIGRIEAGYLMFGADAEYIRYFEDDAPDLSFVSGHFLLRTLFAKIIGINLALGVKSIWGAKKQTGFDMGFPFYLYFTKNLFLDIQPYVAFISDRRIYDIAGGFSFKYRFFGARVAYRGIKTGGQTLHGPQVGVFVQW